MGKTLFDKIWDSHIVASRPGHPDAVYINTHFIHEVTSPQAFDGLRKRGSLFSGRQRHALRQTITYPPWTSTCLSRKH